MKGKVNNSSDAIQDVISEAQMLRSSKDSGRPSRGGGNNKDLNDVQTYKDNISSISKGVQTERKSVTDKSGSKRTSMQMVSSNHNMQTNFEFRGQKNQVFNSKSKRNKNIHVVEA